jgi:hypothetical protein
VKTVRMWIFLGVMLASLIGGRSSLHAQPANQPVPVAEPPGLTDDMDKPWNQGVSEEARAAARELFLEGNRRFRIPLFAKAAERYKAALDKWKHPAFYFNLAIAQLNLGKDVEARESLILALQYGEEPLGAEQFQEAQKQFQDVTRQLGRIRITCSMEEVEVFLDGVKLFTGPGHYEGWAKATSHALIALKTGYYPIHKRVTVSPGELQDADLKLVTLSQAVDASRRWAVWKPWVVFTAGGAIAAASSIPHGLAARNFKAFDLGIQDLGCVKAVPPPGCMEAELSNEMKEQLHRATRQRVIAIGGYIVGGALVATGVVLLYLNRPRLAEQSEMKKSQKRVAIVPAMSAHMIGLSVSITR